MSASHGTPPWSMEYPTGWSTVMHDDRVEAHGPRGAQLRVTTFDPETAGREAHDWIVNAAAFDREKGRPIQPTECGDFRGYETWFDDGDTVVHGWVLACDGFPIDVTYRGSAEHAVADVGELRTALSTLRRTGG